MRNRRELFHPIPTRIKIGLGLIGLGVLVSLGAQDPVWAQPTEDLANSVESLSPELIAEIQRFLAEQSPQVGAVERLTEQIQRNADILWLTISAALVFFMQAGFAMVEAGFTRAKNASNIILKNMMDFCFGSCGFWFLGFGLMFGSHNGLFGTSWFFFSWQQAAEAAGTQDAYPFTFFCFQMVFAATSATIVSGAMAERTKFSVYLIYSLFIAMIVYPISGGWAWNGLFGEYNGGTQGWLSTLDLPYIDFAGSGVVHLCGGAAALAGALMLGPRVGKYGLLDQQPKAIPGHNLPLGVLGVFILWFGWIGFNAGSSGSALPELGWISMNTYLSGAAGAIGSLFTSWAIYGKPDTTFAANGSLAGLVAITAGCATVHPLGALMIGSVAGVLVMISVLFIETDLKIDDPVGAISVHGVCGAWGVLAAGIPFFAHGQSGVTWGQLLSQGIGVIAIGGWGFLACLLLFTTLKYTVGLRVSLEEEATGLDIGEHGNVAYPDFVLTATLEEST